MTRSVQSEYTVKLAQTQQDLRAAQQLRYQVFVRELGAGGTAVDHVQQLERDHFDPHVDHMILTHAPSGDVVGVYRLLRMEQAQAAGSYYSEHEYDLTPLLSSRRNLLELGRSCLRADVRGGMAMHHLWQGLARYIATHRIEVLFGVASFHGTDTARLAAPLSLLHHRHLAPEPLRVQARGPSRVAMNMIHQNQIDRRAAMLQVPSLIKAYLRLGGCVGEGAFVDHSFNTTDVCLVLDTAQMNARRARIYGASPE
jgi:putative hemolysin